MNATCLLIVAAAVLLAAVGPSKSGVVEDDLDKLQGTWVTISMVSDGKTLVGEGVPANDLSKTKLVYEGNKWLIKFGDKTFGGGTLKIDSTKTPKEIDLMDESGMKNDKTKLAIFELNGDTYKYCVAPAGKPRPTEFASKAGSGHSLGVSKREKPPLP